MQYIAPAHYAALTAEFEARGKLLQLKAHTEVLALLRAVEECLVAHRDAGALRAKEAKAAKLAGFASNGMVLCASSEGGETVAFVEPPEDAELGARVLMEGSEAVEPAGPNKVQKKKLMQAAAEELRAIDAVAHAHGKPLVVAGARCVSPTVESGNIN